MGRGAFVLAGAVVAALGIAGAAASTTPAPAFDRGLPTANLNNAAGASRSNVAWSNGNDYVSGDDFTLGSAGETWYVSAIRTWSIATKGTQLGDLFSDDTLYVGTGAIAPVAHGTFAAGSSADSNENISHTPVTYADGSDYQGSSGHMLQIWQNDYRDLGLVVAGGAKLYFGVDGTLRDPSAYYWFNHASNAALSGSTQQGADGYWVAWSKSNLTTPIPCNSAGGSGPCDGGWDKSSDINVQVFAAQVATSPDQCKNGGWRTLVSRSGESFENQGDCVSSTQHENGKGADDQHADGGDHQRGGGH